jgi:hypothetical protein
LLDCNDISDGLVACYSFNGNANDESGNGNNGIPKNGVSLTTDRFGNPDSAYYFSGGSSGNGDYIEVPHSSSLELDQDLTISVWIAPRYLSANSPIICKDKHPGQNYGLWVMRLNQITYQEYYTSDPYLYNFYYIEGPNSIQMAPCSGSEKN